MATKTKTTGTPANVTAQTPAGRLAEALGLVDAGKLGEARIQLEQILAAATGEENLGLARTVRCYLAAVARRENDLIPVEADQPEVQALLLINRSNPQGALECLGQVPVDSGRLFYLKSLAQAQLDLVAEAAESLVRAIQLDPDFMFQYRMEPDFDQVRHSAPFAALERA